MRAKTTMVLDTRRTKSDNTYPVKFRITFERKQQYYPTEFNITKADFEKVMFGQRLGEKEKHIKRTIQSYEDKACGIVDNLSYCLG